MSSSFAAAELDGWQTQRPRPNNNYYPRNNNENIPMMAGPGNYQDGSHYNGGNQQQGGNYQAGSYHNGNQLHGGNYQTGGSYSGSQPQASNYGGGNDPFADYPPVNPSANPQPAELPSPPPYPGVKVDRQDALPESESSGWNLRNWSMKRILLAAVALVAVIIVLVVVIVVVKKKSSYPTYSPLTYRLAETYSGTNFFDNFDYFTGYDPAQGFVHYVDADAAKQYNLTYASSTSAVLKVDTSVTADTVPNASTGRFSVRVSSKNQYSSGLFIFDVLHSPIGCGAWPALWLTDPANWPYNGEIDVMEGVNVVDSVPNQMTLHTSSGCSMSVKRKETGKVLGSSCVNTTDDNAGCGVAAGSNTFGPSFNSNGGGVMAMELRTAGIRMWQFARSAIPADVTGGTPDPSTWGEATADFPSTDCNIGNHFKNQSIIANIDLCGSWAGAATVYAETCSGTCEDQVANNNTAFADAYWEFGSFSIYSAS